MKLIINDIQYDVSDNVITVNLEQLFTFLHSMYDQAPPVLKFLIMGLIREKAGTLVEDMPKGTDPFVYLIHKIPLLAPEILKEAYATFTSGNTDDPFTITSLKLQLQDTGEGGG